MGPPRTGLLSGASQEILRAFGQLAVAGVISPVTVLVGHRRVDDTRNVAGTGYVNTLGWRVDYQKLWGVHPWAQVSYNQQLTTDFSGANRAQDGAWRDVTLGADMSLNAHFAAWAALSQVDNLPTGANYFYLIGVSANF